MGNEIYSIVQSLIGTLPTELEFVYGFCTILFCLMVIFCSCIPFIILYKAFDR